MRRDAIPRGAPKPTGPKGEKLPLASGWCEELNQFSQQRLLHMSQDGSSPDFKRRLLAGILILGATVAVWLLTRPTEQERGSTPTPDAEARLNAGERSVTISSNPVSRSLSNAVPAGQLGLASPAGRIDRGTMLRQLKAWVQRREGREIQILTAQDILDLDGHPAAMNVLVTTNLGSGLTAEGLKDQLAAATARERVLRNQLQEAQQAGEIASVNRLAGELADSRTAFVTSNGVTSYKVSLLRELPPVLAFWPGLPFETVREESARNLAAAQIGEGLGLEGLVHYTSATALLSFTNGTGARMYIDPFRVQEVSLAALQSLRTSKPRRADDGREERIRAQWDDFLGPDSATPNR